MVRVSASRVPFLLAVALIAAALGDFVVESVSNAGFFGGSYHDTDHLTVIPTLIAGAVVAMEIAAMRCLKLVRGTPRRDRSRAGIARAAARLSRPGPVAHDFALVFVLQIGALFAMESGEQWLDSGKLLGGTIWLGGPVAASLLSHAAIGWTCVMLLRWIMRALVETFASLAGLAIGFIFLARIRSIGASFVKRRHEPLCRRAQWAPARRIGGRAPPLLRVTAFLPN